MVSSLDLQEVQVLEEELSPIAGSEGGSHSTKSEYLSLVRKHKLRRPELVTRHGADLLNSAASRVRLGNDLWTVYEQVAIAAMDCHNLDLAKECVGALMKRFPRSLHVGRLEGMWLEARGWWEQADRVYSNLLEEHPAEVPIHKRKIAMLVGKGELPAAVEALNSYLEKFMVDYDAWRQLAEIYMKLQMYKQAAFCYEELLLSSPVNPIYNLTYAELLYTMGGLENLKIARKYFASAVEYSGGKNIRALFGVCMCSSALSLSTKSGRNKEDKESTELPQLALKTIEKEYKNHNPEKLKIAMSALEQLGVSSR